MTESRETPVRGPEMHFGSAELNAEGNFVAVNQPFLAMLGMGENDLLGHNWRVTIHPDDHGRAQQAYQLARDNGRGYVEVRAIRGDSTVSFQAIAVTGLHDERGAFSGYRCVRHDISAYKREQEVLQLEVESAPNGLLMVDTEGRIRSVNRAVESLFGYSREELIGLRVERLLPERYRARHQAYRAGFVASHALNAMDGRDLLGLRKDGVEIPLQVYVNRIDVGGGELVLCTIIDIAERVQHERQLELAKQAAEAANRAKSDFLARMSHEIRTPMNLIIGMNALLLESPLNDAQRQHVEISYRNVRRLLRLINGILDLSKVEAGKVTLESVPFDLREVAEECAATTAAAIEQKGLRFDMSIEPDAWRFWMGDAERLQQVLLNLIGNAVKFTTRGSIGLRVRAETGAAGEPGLRFEVTDTGCGVPPDKAAMIFEAFQQAEGALDRPYEGTGLGLAIAKNIVEMMGGRIWVEQRSAPGSRFVFTIFCQPSSEDVVHARKRGARSAATVAPKVEAGTRVLLAEDNPENVILLRAYLEDLSLSLDFACNGLDALEKRQRGSYDLILMDIQMPVMDGYTATREIRAWESARRAPRVPILALTAHALSAAAAESANAGCDGHLTKPVERDDLVAAISKFAKRPLRASAPMPHTIAARRPAFLANRQQDLLKLRDALAHGDFGTIQPIGHNCKGIGTGYGFPEISSLGSAIEKAARALDAQELEESIREFEHRIQSAATA